MIAVSTPILVVLLILHLAALGCALHLFYPGTFTLSRLSRLSWPSQLRPRRAATHAELWQLVQRPDGAIVAWPYGATLPADHMVADPGPYTRAQIETMAREQ
jgi:hypothetical protein